MNERVLIAGLGNIFLGDDGFGVEAARRLIALDLPEGVRAVDFGIRGMDLAFALLDPWDAVILIDAAPRGGRPGTIYQLEIDIDAVDDSRDPSPDAHAMDPVVVLQMAKAMGGQLKRVLLIGCEPSPLNELELLQGTIGLSGPVEAAVEPAVEIARALAVSLADELPEVAAV